ncbi:glycosyltransferase family 4 protein [Micrococcus terreus]|uniref:glycosyltransferase family 4 protein n=1 Tax=Micrococcus terreus TaxID=574650 RepID=UPI003018048B
MTRHTANHDSVIHLIANQGAVGGGEVMLHHIAAALRAEGQDLTVVAPASPAEVADRLESDGFSVTRIPGEDRKAYALGLRRWALRRPPGLVWCNGLLPAAALTAVRHRIVHLHQEPQSALQRVATALARAGARMTLVPSPFMATRIRGARVLDNWVGGPAGASSDGSPEHLREPDSGLTLGFIGRLSEDKGIHVLLDALSLLDSQDPGRYTVRVAGEPRFVEGGEAARISRALDEAGDTVSLLGWQETYAFLSSIDVLVCPSTWQEPFGLVAAEAMAAGVPVLVTRAGALPDVVGPDHPLIAKPGDAQDLAHVIRTVEDLDLTALVERQHARWRQKWSPEAGRVRIKSLLAQLGLSFSQTGSDCQ